MAWRTVVVTKPSKLDLRLGYMVVRDSENTVRVHISEISVLIIENIGTSITAALLCQLSQQKVKVIFCDEKMNPYGELIPYYGGYDSSLSIRNQFEWKEDYRQAVWTVIVTEKIKNQALCLEYFNLSQAEQLYQYIDEMEFNDATNREGHAAKVYFNALFGKSFSRSQDCPVNAALNYGYSLILSCVNREIACAGYLTQIGLFHSNRFNHFNLSCDLMEPFRPIVDGFVKKLSPEDFSTQEKRKLQMLLNVELVIEDRHQTLLNTVKIYTKSALEAIESGDISLIKLYKYEL
ncbi:MAG: type II CRISPR-associated endonuclease Cas1 [Acutalibacteraceae bacterium]